MSASPLLSIANESGCDRQVSPGVMWFHEVAGALSVREQLARTFFPLNKGKNKFSRSLRTFIPLSERMGADFTLK